MFFQSSVAKIRRIFWFWNAKKRRIALQGFDPSDFGPETTTKAEKTLATTNWKRPAQQEVTPTPGAAIASRLYLSLLREAFFLPATFNFPHMTRWITLCFCFWGSLLLAQDTFSIVAIDTLTGEIGSAGASCLDARAITGGAAVISDLLPGVGAVHTQSYYVPANQQAAQRYLKAGLAAQALLDSMQQDDAESDPSHRQYGAVTIDSSGRVQTAAFTGDSCMAWHGHLTGGTYAIQGNILLGPQVLDSMEARFLRTEGSLARRLMAAMQGANIPGADSRCLEEGVSSQSAFLRVARPTDSALDIHLELIVDRTEEGVEPIDVLQTHYDTWLLMQGNK
jgi:uncharacterized Ntn-hydrolase superfamily protein